MPRTVRNARPAWRNPCRCPAKDQRRFNNIDSGAYYPPEGRSRAELAGAAWSELQLFFLDHQGRGLAGEQPLETLDVARLVGRHLGGKGADRVVLHVLRDVGVEVLRAALGRNGELDDVVHVF